MARLIWVLVFAVVIYVLYLMITTPTPPAPG